MNSMWWFIAALGLGVAEIFTLDLTLLMLAGGALAGGAAASLGMETWVSAVVAFVASILLLFALRPFLLRSMRSRVPLVETNAAALIGKTAKTLTEINSDSGRVKLRGEVWTARPEYGSEAIPEGVEVTIVQVAGATVVVRAN